MSEIDGKMAEWRRTLWGTGPCPDSSQENLTLTDAEREATQWGIALMEDIGMTKHPAALRGMLERTK